MRSLFICSLLLVTSGANVSAQENSAVTDEDVLRVDTDFVTVPVYVTDASGRRVFNLSQEDFTLRDDGRVVKVEYFAAGTARVALVFALDTSGSVREIVARQHEIALALLSRFGTGSRVAVLRFAETVEMAVPFTTSMTEALPAFRFSVLAGDRRTAIFDAAAMAVRSFNAPGSDATERRIIILISEVIVRARALGVSFYVIHLPIFAPRDGRLAARPVSKGFREMAEQTGGRYFVVGDAKSALDPRAGSDLAPVFKAIEDDLQSQYVLGYYPGEAARDASFHRIEISLTPRDKRKLRVRSLREGYILKSRKSGVWSPRVKGKKQFLSFDSRTPDS
jgi:Ca-activated chloride channel family protein